MSRLLNILGINPSSANWANQVEVLISDPSRTIADLLLDPQLGEGIDNVINIFSAHLMSEMMDINLLLDYAKRLYNDAVLKRLGYLLERCKSGEFNVIEFCKMLMPTGYIKLDPGVRATKLITRWGLWVQQ